MKRPGEIDFFEISKESSPDAHFEKSEIPLHEEQQDGLIVHASNITEPATAGHELLREKAGRIH